LTEEKRRGEVDLEKREGREHLEKRGALASGRGRAHQELMGALVELGSFVKNGHNCQRSGQHMKKGRKLQGKGHTSS
jgi:hypothetical protein